MIDNKNELEKAARNARIEKELAAALSNKTKGESAPGGKGKKGRRSSNGDKTPAKSCRSKKTGNNAYLAASPMASFSNPEAEQKKKVRGPKKPLDFSTLSDVTFVNEVPVFLSTPFVATCSICGGTKNVGYFKNANICLKCLNKIKHTM